jgi:hypothetical protein
MMTAAAWWAVGIVAGVVAAGMVLGRFLLSVVLALLLGLVRWTRWVREAAAGRREAAQRAEALLVGWLSAAQRAQYCRWGWFEVHTAAGHRYGIWPGRVVRLDVRGAGYCIEATTPVPVAEEMLANKLLLETDERRFLATAHRYRYVYH